MATTQYPFARRMSVASAASVDTVSPTTTPLFTGRVRTLSRAGPIARTSNPMLAATFRSHGIAPATPALESTMGDMYMPAEARAAGAGRFERDFALVLALGNGEFSQVWKVCSKADGEIWAIKTGRPYTGHKNRLRQLEEVAILRVLGKEQHPHIVRYLESWEQAGRLYIRTEMAECGDLSRYLLSLGDTGGLDEGRVWKMLVELTSALNHIHGHGVLHLDFKPSNVLITREGSLKVADFGLSVFADEQEEKERFTDDNDHNDLYDEGRGRGLGLAPSPILERDFEGDREYLCPEALRDAAPGRPADIFSLGIMTLEAALNVVLPSSASLLLFIADIRRRRMDKAPQRRLFRPGRPLRDPRTRLRAERVLRRAARAGRVYRARGDDQGHDARRPGRADEAGRGGGAAPACACCGRYGRRRREGGRACAGGRGGRLDRVCSRRKIIVYISLGKWCIGMNV